MGGLRPAGAAKNRAIRRAMTQRQEVERQKKPKPQGAGEDRTKTVVQNAFSEYEELMRQAHEQNQKISEQVRNGVYEGAQSETEMDLMERFYGRDPF